MRAYFGFVLRHRVLVVVACLAVTALAGWSMSRATMASSLGELVLGDHPAYHRYIERVKQFGSDEQLIIAFEDRDARRLLDELAVLYDVADVAGRRSESQLGPHLVEGLGE